VRRIGGRGVEDEVSANGTGPRGQGRHAGAVDFLTLWNDPTRCAELPLEAIPAVLLQIASGLTRLTALQNALAARMLGAPGPRPPSRGAPWPT
jgi:hypothetical protein